MKSQLLLSTLAALAFTACSNSLSTEESSAAPPSLYTQAPPVNAFQIAENTFYGPGHEAFLLYDAQGQINGMVELVNSPHFLFLNVIPQSPWLIAQAAAECWATPPATLDPTNFTAQRSFATNEDSAQLWMPLPQEITQYQETLTVIDQYIYVAVVAQAADGTALTALSTADNGNPYVQYMPSSYSGIPDPEISTQPEPTSSSSVSPEAASSEAASSEAASSAAGPNPTESSAAQTDPTEQPISSSSTTAQSSDTGSTGPTSSAAPATDWNLCGKIADGRTIGFWKNNLVKYMAGASKGTQIAAADMQQYLDQLGLNADAALAVLSSTSSDPRDLLAKQLLGSRFNLARGATIADDQSYTENFILWGQQLLADSTANTAALLAAKDLFDAYNNSHGGAIAMNCKL